MPRDVRIEYLTKALADELQPLADKIQERGWPVEKLLVEHPDGRITLSIQILIWPVKERHVDS